MAIALNPVDRVEILTLQDNMVDLVSRDESDVVKRARLKRGPKGFRSLLAEHGFSALITVYRGEEERSLVFDFGFSEHGAAWNAEALGVDLTGVEALALSHGHLDHTGGLKALCQLIGRQGLPFVVHPAAFRSPRYVKISETQRAEAPTFSRDAVQDAGCALG